MTSDATSEQSGGPVLPRSVPGDPGSVHVLLGRARTRVVLTGEIDAGLGPDLLEAATEAEDAGLPVDVDSQHVTFMDSTGVAFLARLASRSDDRLRLIRPPAVVKFLVDVTSIGDLVDVLDDDPGFDATPPGSADGGDDDTDDPDGPDLIA